MRYGVPMLRRFVTKLVHDVLPAALASVIGGFLFTHFQAGQFGRQPEPVAAAEPASAEMMQLLRDEHGLIVNFLNARLAKEKQQLAAEENAPRIAFKPLSAGLTPAPRQSGVALTAAKLLGPHGKTALAGVPLQPLVIAQAQPSESAKPRPPGDESFLAKTLGIKDHVIAVTQRVVSAIGGIPSWIGAIGDRIGGSDATPRPPTALLVRAS